MTIAIEQLSLPELKSFLHEQAQDTFQDLRDEARLNLLAEKWHANAEFCTCRNEGRLVGMVAFYANQPESGTAYLPHVYVSPVFRGKGAFKRMLQIIEFNIEKKGFKEIKLEVHEENIRAQQVYLKYGFAKLYKINDNSVYMSKILKV